MLVLVCWISPWPLCFSLLSSKPSTELESYWEGVGHLTEKQCAIKLTIKKRKAHILSPLSTKDRFRLRFMLTDWFEIFQLVMSQFQRKTIFWQIVFIFLKLLQQIRRSDTLWVIHSVQTKQKTHLAAQSRATCVIHWDIEKMSFLISFSFHIIYTPLAPTLHRSHGRIMVASTNARYLALRLVALYCRGLWSEVGIATKGRQSRYWCPTR